MIFKCKNCGGNVVYSPEKQKMYCPYCESEESQEVQSSTSGDLAICPDCGGQIPVGEHMSATQCPYCSNFIVFDERVEGAYQPQKIIPFRMGKEVCKNAIREHFKKKVFAPTDFLSEVRLNGMQGVYVPFWFYDYDMNVDYQGQGTKVRSWTSGDTRYTETSYFDVRRELDVDFRGIPADASADMPDDVMDLMEPYGYDQLEAFKPEYLSGFFSEKYNMEADVTEGRARAKADSDAQELLQREISGYGSVRQIRNTHTVRGAAHEYGLLPVWRYLYHYKDKDYPFYVNGQTGKIVGEAPLSVPKVWAYAGTLWACLLVILLGISSLV